MEPGGQVSSTELLMHIVGSFGSTTMPAGHSSAIGVEDEPLSVPLVPSVLDDPSVELLSVPLDESLEDEPEDESFPLPSHPTMLTFKLISLSTSFKPPQPLSVPLLPSVVAASVPLSDAMSSS